jgi:hypothetical protein
MLSFAYLRFIICMRYLSLRPFCDISLRSWHLIAVRARLRSPRDSLLTCPGRPRVFTGHMVDVWRSPRFRNTSSTWPALSNRGAHVELLSHGGSCVGKHAPLPRTPRGHSNDARFGRALRDSNCGKLVSLVPGASIHQAFRADGDASALRLNCDIPDAN